MLSDPSIILGNYHLRDRSGSVAGSDRIDMPERDSHGRLPDLVVVASH
jgi:hypothetical protein